jgi:hypothetical protein
MPTWLRIWSLSLPAGLMACATAPTGSPPDALAVADAPVEIEVRVVAAGADVDTEPEVRCRAETLPGSRIVIGEICESIDDSRGVSVGIVDDEQWELVIVAPGVYEMRRRQP